MLETKRYVFQRIGTRIAPYHGVVHKVSCINGRFSSRDFDLVIESAA
jgi:hypothetical protein